MKASEMGSKPAAELRAELLKLRKEQFALRLQRATGQAIKPDQFGKVRRSIARLKTALRAREPDMQAIRTAGKAASKLAAPAAKASGKPAAKSAAKPAAKKATRAVKKTGAK
jgi:large subunit ribosomal protein L29